MASVVLPAIEAHRAQPDTKFDPTEIRLSESGSCPRKQLLRVLGYPETNPQPQEARNLMEGGHVWEHWVVQRLIEHYGAEAVHTQVEIATPEGAGGHIDVLVLPAGKPGRIVEIKSTKAASKRYLPKDEHKRQLQGYLHYRGRVVGIDQGELAYVLRETGEVITFEVTYDPSIGQDIEAEQKMLAQLKRERRVPSVPPDVTAKTFPCFYSPRDYQVYCPYYGHCWPSKDR